MIISFDVRDGAFSVPFHQSSDSLYFLSRSGCSSSDNKSPTASYCLHVEAFSSASK